MLPRKFAELPLATHPTQNVGKDVLSPQNNDVAVRCHYGINDAVLFQLDELLIRFGEGSVARYPLVDAEAEK